MSTLPPTRRALQLLSTARSNPEFALRVARRLAPSERGGFVARLSTPEREHPAPRRPGLAKCARSPYSEANGLTAQLATFALGGRRR